MSQASARPARLLRFQKTADALNEGIVRRVMPLQWQMDIYGQGTDPEYRVSLDGVVDLVRVAAARISQFGNDVRQTAEGFARADGRNPAEYLDWHDDPTFSASEVWFNCDPGDGSAVPKATPWPKLSSGEKGTSEFERILALAQHANGGAHAVLSGIESLANSQAAAGAGAAAASSGSVARGAAAGSRSVNGLQNLGPGLGNTLSAVGFGLSAISSYSNDTQHTGVSRFVWAAGSAGVSSVAGWAGASAGIEAGTVLCAAGGPGTVAVCAAVGAFAGALGATTALNKVQEALSAPPPGSENTKKLRQQIEDPFKNGNKVTPVMTAAR